MVVPIYPTNSPEECQWVAGNSGSVAVVCEDAGQVAKIVAVRERLPALRTIVVIEPAGETADAISLDEVRERGRGRDAAELEARTAAVTPEDPFTFIYTSGTTGPPKGCVLTHGNYRRVVTMLESAGAVQDEEVTYLFLPLAHAYELLIELFNFDVGTTIAYYGGDGTQIVPELQQVRPDLPAQRAAPLREDVRERDLLQRPRSRRSMPAAAKLRRPGPRRCSPRRGAPAGPARARPGESPTGSSRRCAPFGGRVRQFVTGAAPIALPILEFFWAAGLPILEVYGMTEATVVTHANRGRDTARHRRPGDPAARGEDRRRRRDPLRGPYIFQGYSSTPRPAAALDGWLHTGDIGAVDADGYLRITDRKKHLIITAGGKNLSPANIENAIKCEDPLVSQVVTHGDRRPYPVMLITLDEEEIVRWANERGARGRPDAAHAHPERCTRSSRPSSIRPTRSTPKSSRSSAS